MVMVKNWIYVARQQHCQRPLQSNHVGKSALRIQLLYVNICFLFVVGFSPPRCCSPNDNCYCVQPAIICQPSPESVDQSDCSMLGGDGNCVYFYPYCSDMNTTNRIQDWLMFLLTLSTAMIELYCRFANHGYGYHTRISSAGLTRLPNTAL